MLWGLPERTKMESFATTVSTWKDAYLDDNFCASDPNFCLYFTLKDFFHLIPGGFWFPLRKERERERKSWILFLWYYPLQYFKIHNKNINKTKGHFPKIYVIRSWKKMAIALLMVRQRKWSHLWDINRWWRQLC